MDWQHIKMGRNDRGVLIGHTGYGKTFLGRYLIEDKNKRYSVTYDAKISKAIGEWNQEFIYDFAALQESEARRIVYRPSEFEESDPVWQNRFFEWVYKRGATRLFVDEAYALEGGTNPSRYLLACISRGRERGISTLVGTQRPARIPQIVLTEPEHIYVFFVLGVTDRQKIKEISGGLISLEDQLELDEHEFFYFNLRRGVYIGDGQFDRRGNYAPKKLKVTVQE